MGKKCVYNVNVNDDPIIRCDKKATYEVGFIKGCMHEEDTGDDFQDFFCTVHFNDVKSCMNTTKYRKIDEKDWREFL